MYIPRNYNFNHLLHDPHPGVEKYVQINFNKITKIIHENDTRRKSICINFTSKTKKSKKRLYTVTYGTVSEKHNVSAKFINNFVKYESGDQISVGKNIIFNKCFGDPHLKCTKTVDISYDNKLILTLPEFNRPDIDFILPTPITTDNITSNNIYRLIIVAIFKNESHILDEWIQFHIKQGVDKIFLIDNGSTDDYLPVIKKYTCSGKVNLVIDGKKYQQLKHYNKYFKKYFKLSDWVMCIDLDEFVYSRKGYARIIDYLDSLNFNVRKIFLQWKMYGSDGNIQQPDSVLHNFTRRSSVSNPVRNFVFTKTIIRGHLLSKGITSIHHINRIPGKISSRKFDHICKGCWCKVCFGDRGEEINAHNHLHLNHYAIQSKEWFENVKMTRGDACSKVGDSLRNDTYFNKYDRNDILDTEILSKI